MPAKRSTPAAPGAEEILDRFHVAWRTGNAPRIADYLPSAPPGDAARRALLGELVRIDLEFRWRLAAPKPAPQNGSAEPAGPRLEDYVRWYQELGTLEQLPDELIAEEYWVRQRWGDRPSHAEFAARFPRSKGLLAALRAIDVDLAAEVRCQPGKSLERKPLMPEPGPAPQPEDRTQPPVSVAALRNAILDNHLLSPIQSAELQRRPSAPAAEPRTLARDLLQRGWLTAYQVNQLLQGRGHELLVGSYVILERLGEGGTGQVFKARHQKMDRVVALKVIRKELLADAEVVGRFSREIQVLSRLNHANVVRSLDAGPLAQPTSLAGKGAVQGHFLAMEFIEGTDLAKLVKQGEPLPVEQACAYIRQAALGLQHAHEKGMVHRDIKPHNLIMSLKEGLIKVADLGLARLQRTVNEDLTAVFPDAKGTGTLTPVDAVMMGTVDYMAPEQALDFHRADIRADIYSLGCTFYFLLTGQPPFAGGTLAQKVVKHQNVSPVPVSQFRKDLPPGLVAVLDKMLAKRPEDRFQTPAEVATALAGLGTSAWEGSIPYTPSSSRWYKRKLPIALLGVLLLCVVGALIFKSIAPSMRNAALRDLRDNTWVRLAPFQARHAGSHEVMLCYDPDRRRMIRVGGVGPDATNEIWTFDLGTTTWTEILPPAADVPGQHHRPGFAAGRGICYDRQNKCVWEYGGAHGSGGLSGLWKGLGGLAIGNWTRTEAVGWTYGSRVGYDEHARRVICLGGYSSGFSGTSVYDPATDKAVVAAVDRKFPAAAQIITSGAALLYVPELKGCLLVGALQEKSAEGPGVITWLFDATAGQWRDLAPKGPAPSRRLSMGMSYDRKARVVVLFGGRTDEKSPQFLADTWVYDPVANSWKEVKSDSAPRQPAPQATGSSPDCQMMAYDEEHNVHVLVLQDWNKDNAVWVYRYKR
jgi:serine/threonine-protein kinase